jgi:hypothetical protein
VPEAYVMQVDISRGRSRVVAEPRRQSLEIVLEVLGRLEVDQCCLKRVPSLESYDVAPLGHALDDLPFRRTVARFRNELGAPGSVTRRPVSPCTR